MFNTTIKLSNLKFDFNLKKNTLFKVKKFKKDLIGRCSVEV